MTRYAPRSGPSEFGGLSRRVATLEREKAAPSTVSSGGGDSWTDAIVAAGTLLGWWRCGETISYAGVAAKSGTMGDNVSSVQGLDQVLADTSGASGGPRNMDYREPTSSTLRPARILNPTLGDDDGAQQFDPAGFSAFWQHWTDGAGNDPTRFAGSYTGGVTGTLRTVVCWLKTRVSGAITGPVVAKTYAQTVGTGGTYLGWQIRADAGSLTFRADDNATSAATLTANTWYMAAVTWDSTAYRLYVNGALVGAPLATAIPSYATSSLFGFGYGLYKSGFQQLAEFWQGGAVDEVALFSTALSGGDILSLYEAGTTGGDSPGGQVLTADGAGGTSWEYPTVETRVNGA